MSDENKPETFPPAAIDGFGVAAVAAGLAGLFCCCLFTGLPCGVLAVFFALISRSRNGGWNSLSRIGLAFGLVSACLSLLMALLFPLLMDTPAFQEALRQFAESTGDPGFGDPEGETAAIRVQFFKVFCRVAF